MGIRVEPENLFLTQTHQKQLSATFNGSPARAVWFSSDPSIATVDATGFVTASPSNSGKAIITAVSGIFRNSTTVTVVPPPSVNRLDASPSLATAGQSVSLMPLFSNGTGVINGTDGSSLNVISGVAVQVVPFGNTAYALVVTNSAGDTATQLRGVPTVPPPVITSFYPSSQFVTQGNSVSLFGSFTGGAANIRTAGGVFIAAPSVSPFGVSDTPAMGGNTTYLLAVTNAAGSTVTANVTVQVVPPPAITSFTVTPTGGGLATFTATFGSPGLMATLFPGNIPMTVSGNTGSVTNVTAPSGTTFYLVAINQAGTFAVGSVPVP